MVRNPGRELIIKRIKNKQLKEHMDKQENKSIKLFNILQIEIATQCCKAAMHCSTTKLLQCIYHHFLSNVCTKQKQTSAARTVHSDERRQFPDNTERSRIQPKCLPGKWVSLPCFGQPECRIALLLVDDESIQHMDWSFLECGAVKLTPIRYKRSRWDGRGYCIN